MNRLKWCIIQIKTFQLSELERQEALELESYLTGKQMTEVDSFLVAQVMRLDLKYIFPSSFKLWTFLIIV